MFQTFCKLFGFLFLTVITPVHAQSETSATTYSLPLGIGALTLEGQCGSGFEVFRVKEYQDETILDLSRQYVEKHSVSSVQLRWRSASAFDGQLTSLGYRHFDLAGRSWCSGTLVGTHYILTAGHCLQPFEGRFPTKPPVLVPLRPKSGKIVPANAETLATLLEVHFGFLEGEDGADVFKIKNIVDLKLENGLDYSVLEIVPNARTMQILKEKYESAEVSVKGVSVGDPLLMFQHPGGEPLKVAGGTVGSKKNGIVFYSDLDTLPGSSGAAIRNKKGQIVGVHSSGNCLRGGPGNYATGISDILERSDFISSLSNKD
ncbi:trypsin-like serine peptidase [Roseibium algae]|uniref:Trypsin-like peptidase domain-containing protein n=1 Tax=Roseibium algae TaxID=3123038 RepID=A0ABU8TT45_9HYPH